MSLVFTIYVSYFAKDLNSELITNKAIKVQRSQNSLYLKKSWVSLLQSDSFSWFNTASFIYSTCYERLEIISLSG